MTDFEDSNSPNWFNQVQGQVNLCDAIRRKISFTNEKGKEYKLNDKVATLQIRPRGWHLDEKHVLVDGARVRSEEHTSELQSLMRISYAVFCLKKKRINSTQKNMCT